MEVKVWVDGIQRVVCGASWDTTCQDVVIALAHALGRTGRFTLIEKWRDNERPLTPAECPLQVLHKWGEYAAEVRFVLCQADSERQKLASQERLVKKGMEKSASMHRIVSPQIQGAESSVKRSLTFSGAHHHHQPVEEAAWLNASAPTSKFRKTHQGPVPNGDVRQVSGPRCSPNSSTQATGDGRSGDTLTAASSSLSPSEHPHRRHSPARQQQGNLPNSTSGLPSLSLSSSLGHHQLGNANRPSAFQPPMTLRSRAVSPPKSSSGPEGHPVPPPQSQPRLQPQPGPLPQSNPDSQSQSHSQTSPAYPDTGSQPHSHPGPVQQQQQHKTVLSSSSPHADYIPHSFPTVPSSFPSPRPDDQNPPSNFGHKTSDTSTTTSEPVGPQIEEYDLDHNFPGSHKDWNHNETPADSLEYRLEEGLGSRSVSGSGGHLEGEHAKLLKLVNMQQQRLKTQESQISLVNTEISSLEEKEMEYEENLHIIMEELLLQENRQRDLEPQLNDLEKVEWKTVLEEEKKCEIDLTLQVVSCKAMILQQEQQLEDVKNKETELLSELQQEEEDISQARERLKEEESRAGEEESRTEEEIDKLQTEFSEVQKMSADCAASLGRVESELSWVEEDVKEKGQVLKKLEADLKEENLKEFGAQPVSEVAVKTKDSDKMLRKILEDSLSPRMNVGFPREGASNPPGPALLATFAMANQSGVWV